MVIGAFNKEKALEEGLLRAQWNTKLCEGSFTALFPSQVSSSQYDAALTLSQISWCAARELLQSTTTKHPFTSCYISVGKIEISPVCNVCALSCVVQYKHEIALFTRNIDQSIYNLNVNFKPTADFCCLKWISGVFAQNGHPMVKVWWFAVGGCYHILFVATKVFLQLIKVSTICDQIFSERVTQTSAPVTAS